MIFLIVRGVEFLILDDEGSYPPLLRRSTREETQRKDGRLYSNSIARPEVLVQGLLSDYGLDSEFWRVQKGSRTPSLFLLRKGQRLP